METTNTGAPYAPENKTKLIVIKGNGNHGKTTTCWMVLLELIAQGATVKTFNHVSFHGNPISPIPTLPQPYDFYAEVEFNKKQIVINSHGDTPKLVDQMLQHALPMEPDFIVCSSRSQQRTGSTWGLFESKYTNLLYQRVCVWPEFAAHECDKLCVKMPVVEIIIKVMK